MKLSNNVIRSVTESKSSTFVFDFIWTTFKAIKHSGAATCCVNI